MAKHRCFRKYSLGKLERFLNPTAKFGQVSNLVKPGVGFNLVEYSDDQYSVTTGVGRKLNEKWAGNVSVGYDTGAGNPCKHFRSNRRLLERRVLVFNIALPLQPLSQVA